MAVARYITFAAVALHENPEQRQALATGDTEFQQMFVQEVRRYYPFFPAVAAKTRKEFEWQGYRFPEGVRVMLDLYGTNRDERIWDEPEAFRPNRFRDWNGSPFNFIPQGGGDHYANHRCPGEWITIELTKRALHLLTTAMRYDVPPQDLHISRSRIPAIPRSRFLMANVQRV